MMTSEVRTPRSFASTACSVLLLVTVGAGAQDFPRPDLKGLMERRAFVLTVPNPSPYVSSVVQASTNLVNWVNIYTNSPPFTFTDAADTKIHYRFYRLEPPTLYVPPLHIAAELGSPGALAPGKIPGLRLWWGPESFVRYTNTQPIPAIWRDKASKLIMSNDTHMAATYGVNALNGNPGIYFSGGPLFACTNAATPSMITNCLFAIVCRDTLQDGRNEVMMCFATTNVGNPGFFVNGYITAAAPSAIAPGTMSIDITNSRIASPVVDGNHSIDILVGRFSVAGTNKLNFKCWHNGYPAFDTTLTAGGAGGGNFPIYGGDGMTGTFYLGGSPCPGTPPWEGYLGDVLFYSDSKKVYTDAQAASLNEMLTAKYLPGVPFVIDGASIEVGAGTILHSNIAQIASPLLPQYNIVTTAVGGCGSRTMYNNMLNWVKTKKPAGGVVFLGSDVVLNDMKWTGVPLSTSESYITNYAATVRKNGWKFILGGAASADWWETNSVDTRSNLIVWERANWQKFADGFADFSLDPLVGPNGSCSNLVAYPDGDHLHMGNAVYVSMINNELIPAWQYATKPRAK